LDKRWGSKTRFVNIKASKYPQKSATKGKNQGEKMKKTNKANKTDKIEKEIKIEKEEMDVKKIEGAYKNILKAMGSKISSDENLKGTPKRIAESYLELFSGIYDNPANYLKKTYKAPSTNIIIEKDIDFYSMCEHHFLPFFGKIHLAYIPNEKIVGFGSLLRVISTLAKRPQLQERFAEEIAQVVYENLECQGVLVVVIAKHLCMTMRGEKMENSQIITTVSKGILEKSDEKRLEVLTSLYFKIN